MAETTIHGVSGTHPPNGWQWHSNDWAKVIVKVAPGQTELFCDATVAPGPDIQVAPAGTQNWALKAQGDTFHVTSDAPVVCRATGPSASFTLRWGPAWLLEANRAYEGRRGTATRD